MSAQHGAATHLPASRPAAAAGTSRRRVLLQNLGLFLLSALGTLVALELVFRIFFPQPLFAVEYAPWGVAHTPNAEFTHGSMAWLEGRWLNGTEYVTHIKYNSKGFRDYERAYAKPPEVVRILILGDSYGEGMEVELEQTTAKVLERRLNEWLIALPPDARPAAEVERSSGPNSPVAAALAAGQQPDVPPLGPGPEVVGAHNLLADEAHRTREIFNRLAADASGIGARLLVANIHLRGDEFVSNARFWRELGADVVDVSADTTNPRIRNELHYRYDGHWNARGHTRAAVLIGDKIIADGLLPISAETRRVETINTSMSAYSTCKELMLFEAEGYKYQPDLVLLLYTSADERNTVDRDLCQIAPDGRLITVPAAYSAQQELVRSVRGYIKRTSHFLTFLLDRLNRVDAVHQWTFQLEDRAPIKNVDIDAPR